MAFEWDKNRAAERKLKGPYRPYFVNKRTGELKFLSLRRLYSVRRNINLDR